MIHLPTFQAARAALVCARLCVAVHRERLLLAALSVLEAEAIALGAVELADVALRRRVEA